MMGADEGEGSGRRKLEIGDRTFGMVEVSVWGEEAHAKARRQAGSERGGKFAGGEGGVGVRERPDAS